MAGGSTDVPLRWEAELDEGPRLPSDLVLVLGIDGTIRYASPSVQPVLGYDPDDLRLNGDILHAEDLALVIAAWQRSLAHPGMELSAEARVRRADGHHRWLQLNMVNHIEDPTVAGVVVRARDITERRELEARLAHQANHDPLTGLPNRSHLLDRLAEALGRAELRSHGIAILFIDLDHFKLVNDSLGHSVGDRLLCACGERIRGLVRPGDVVARFGGDEVVVLVDEVDSQQAAVNLAARIDTAFSDPFAIGANEVFVGVSIGISYAPPGSGADPESLISDADAAMYKSKSSGRGQYTIYDEALRKDLVGRLETANALRRALERQELRLHYQPAIDLRSGATVGLEALVRWDHPERGLIPPAQFIGIAEETGVIVPIGTWVLEQALTDLAGWQRSLGRPDLTIQINISGRQLLRGDFLSTVDRLLDECGVTPGTVGIELTESVLLDDVLTTGRTLNGLKDLGVSVIIDDFGTGYSSLTYLHRFPVDAVKIDREFVAGLGADEGDTAIVTAVVNLAATLKLGAIAEGVETDEQLRHLRELRCDQAQGFLLSRPIEAAAAGEWLAGEPISF